MIAHHGSRPTATLNLSPVRTDTHSWQVRGACVGEDPELWFAENATDEKYGNHLAAVRICLTCPVRQTCLDDVLATEKPGQRNGIWGAATPKMRDRIVAQRRQDGAA